MDIKTETVRPKKISSIFRITDNFRPFDLPGEKLRVGQNKQFSLEVHNPSENLRKSLNNAAPSEEKTGTNILINRLDKWSKGTAVKSTGVETTIFKEKQNRRGVYLEYAEEQAARTEILLKEQYGFIKPDKDELTADYRQPEIVQNVDILGTSKYFKLNLDFGPYTMRYSRNGRHLLLGGRCGHVAVFEWVTKKLLCELNVMEDVVDISWLHVHTMFACAQKDWVYIYDSQGTQLHCVKRLYKVNCLEFLPYHFLLATGNKDGYLSWLDVSIGEIVSNFNIKLGAIRIMHQNPANGALCIGGIKGVVSMWSPKVRDPLAKLVCHSTPMTTLTVDPKGKYMVTAGQDRKVKVWDVRALNVPLVSYQLRLPANKVVVSQSGCLAYSQGSYCEIQPDLLLGEKEKTPYLRQRCDALVHSMQFCPYEDVLGISTVKGFQSLLVPGSGEPNFDALEDNPYQTKVQRREHEVHSLLEKIPPELISLNPYEIATVDVSTLQEKVVAKRSLFHLKPHKIDFQSRHKMRGRGGSAKASRNKQITKDLKRKEFIKDVQKSRKSIFKRQECNNVDFIPSVFHRFKPKCESEKKLN